MTYRHYIQVYLIILHKYSSGNLYWPSLFSASVENTQRKSDTHRENVHAHKLSYKRQGIRYTAHIQ